MSDGKIETTKGLCVVALTRYIMEHFDVPQDKAYEKLLGMEIYSLLMDTETRLFLEPNSYLCRCCQKELDEGKDGLYSFINEDDSFVSGNF